MTVKRGRVFRPKLKELKGTPYDSMTEKRLHEGVFTDFPHHNKWLHYNIEHKYEPDFTLNCECGKVIYVEVKGYMQDRAEATKYVWIKKALKDNEELVFIFEKPDKPMHFQSKRKDGTKMSHREWCIKNGFRVFDEKTCKDLLEEV